MSRHVLASLALVIVVATSLAGQSRPVGSLTWQIVATPPASLSSQIPGGEVPKVRIRVASDGRRLAFAVSISDSGATGIMAMLSDLWVKVIARAAGDSLELAVAIPPGISAMLGSKGDSVPPGYRMTVAMPKLDSLLKATPTAPQPDLSAKPLGRRRTVAGFGCEDWELSVTGEAAKILVCMVENPPAALTIGNWFGDQVGLEKLLAMSKQPSPFQGRKLMPIRFSMSGDSTVVELVQATTGAPGADAFQIPRDFKVFDPKTLDLGKLGLPPGIIPKKS